MSKTSDFDWQFKTKFFDDNFWQPGHWWQNATSEEKAACEEAIENYWKCPTDLDGKVLKVGKKVACATTLDRSAVLVIGIITEIDREKGIQVEEIKRTYQSKPLRRVRYGFPNRIVVIDDMGL